MAGKRNQQRERLAYLAARIMAEDGSQDFSAAKRKAARQAGVEGTQQLPDNREIEAALRSWQSLYQRDSLQPLLRELRAAALEAMRILEPFDPWLIGSVLSGSVGPHSDINLQLFTDDHKELGLDLLNRGLDYEMSQRKIRLGDRTLDIPVISFEVHNRVVNAQLYPRDAQRVAQKTGDGRLIERARASQVRELLDLSVIAL